MHILSAVGAVSLGTQVPDASSMMDRAVPVMCLGAIDPTAPVVVGAICAEVSVATLHVAAPVTTLRRGP